jgi:hypothetical protein
MIAVFMKHRILSWNVRGLNEGKKRLKVRRLLNQWKVDIVCLQETKLEVITTSLVQSLWRCLYAEWCYVASIGALGGILLMWDRRVVTKVDTCVGNLGMWKMVWCGLLQGCMVLIGRSLEGSCGRNW